MNISDVQYIFGAVIALQVYVYLNIGLKLWNAVTNKRECNITVGLAMACSLTGIAAAMLYGGGA